MINAILTMLGGIAFLIVTGIFLVLLIVFIAAIVAVGICGLYGIYLLAGKEDKAEQLAERVQSFSDKIFC